MEKFLTARCWSTVRGSQHMSNEDSNVKVFFHFSLFTNNSCSVSFLKRHSRQSFLLKSGLSLEFAFISEKDKERLILSRATK